MHLLVDFRLHLLANDDISWKGPKPQTPEMGGTDESTLLRCMARYGILPKCDLPNVIQNSAKPVDKKRKQNATKWKIKEDDLVSVVEVFVDWCMLDIMSFIDTTNKFRRWLISVGG